jgi:transcriptional regulator with XRE-family HTH domain
MHHTAMKRQAPPPKPRAADHKPAALLPPAPTVRPTPKEIALARRRVRKRTRKEQRIARILGPTAPARGKGIPVLLRGHALNDIARGTGLNQSYLSKLTLGKGSPSLATCERLRVYLELPTIDAVLAVLASAGAVYMDGRREVADKQAAGVLGQNEK